MNTRKRPFLRLICALLLSALCATLLPGCAEQSKTAAAEEQGIIPNEIILAFRESASREQIQEYLSQQNAAVDDTLSDIGIYRLILPAPLPQVKLEALAAKLQNDKIVEKAHLNTVMDAGAASVDDRFYPNDPWDGDSWDIAVPGGENWGLEAIDAPGAWRYLDRMTTVNMGLIEEHVPNHLHPDLKGLFFNRQCLVIDKNGNFEEVNPNAMEPDSHSTRVAGIMNAAFNNSEGVAGVMGGKGKLYSYAIEDNEDIKDEVRYSGCITGYTYLIALKELIDQDVRVINISMGGTVCCYAASHGSQPAIDYITRQADLATDVLSRIIEEREAQGKPDFVIVVAAGNVNNDTFYKDDDAYLGYREKKTFWEILRSELGLKLKNAVSGGTLAKYGHFLNAIEEPLIKDRVIVVGAVGIDSENSTETSTQYISTVFSNLGDRVDLVAPGKKIYGCTVNGYGTLGGSGTSFAAPHVSGTAGLVFACDPTLSGPQVKEILLSTATGSYAHGDASSGMVNASLAVEKALGLTEEETAKTEPSAGETKVDVFPDASEEDLSAKEPVGFVVVTEVTYPEGNWTDDQKTYMYYLATKQYVDYISNPWIQEACRDHFIDNNYTFRDLDFDGTEELILWLGYTGADGEIMVFTMDDGYVCYVGSAPCDGTGTHLFCADHDDEFYLVSYDGSEIYGSVCELSNGQLRIISHFISGDIPFRWDLVDWLGSLPLKTREVEQPVYDSDSTHGYEAFLRDESYVYFRENQSVFDDWMSGLTTADHWVYDMDHDGIKELIVRLGNPSGDNELLIFTRSGREPIYLGSIPCRNRIGICVNNIEQGFLMVTNDGMLESITRCTVENGSLQVTENYVDMESLWAPLAPLAW